MLIEAVITGAQLVRVVVYSEGPGGLHLGTTVIEMRPQLTGSANRCGTR